jgi:hypothetical protein
MNHHHHQMLFHWIKRLTAHGMTRLDPSCTTLIRLWGAFRLDLRRTASIGGGIQLCTKLEIFISMGLEDASCIKADDQEKPSMNSNKLTLLLLSQMYSCIVVIHICFQLL